MIFREAYEVFRKESPVPVMARAAMQNAFSASQLDRIFAENAKQQRAGDLPFSVVVEILSLAVMKVCPSVNAAYQKKEEQVGVAIKSVYNKLNGVEPCVSRAMVCDSAARFGEIQDAMGRTGQLQPGYRTRILDGKHLDRTERRLKPLRFLNSAPLPGQVLAVLDGDRNLVCDVFPCEDGHAQERSLLEDVLARVAPGELWIGDRNFCTVSFLTGIAQRNAHFGIRLRKQLPVERVGRKRAAGNSATGKIFEQAAYIVENGQRALKVRLITVKLKQPTRDGDTEITIVSNLPKKVSPKRIAELYRNRWTIEKGFLQVSQSLNGEIDSLAYPKAALFGFCIALVAHNMLNLVKAAIATAHEGDEDDLSDYYLADEISGVYRGMLIVLPPVFWRERFGDLGTDEMAEKLLNLAADVNWDHYRKHRRGPKRPPPNLGHKNQRNHVATKRVLDEYYATNC